MLNFRPRHARRTSGDSSAREHARAFSLIELIVVITITAIIGVVAIARSGSSYQFRQRSGARLLQIDLMHVRERAISSGRATWAQVQPAAERVLYAQTPAGAAANSAGATSLADSATGSQMTTPFNTAASGLDLSGVLLGTAGGATTDQWLGFDWQGRPLDSGGALRTSDFAITITASLGVDAFSEISVIVTPESGLVRVSP